MNEGRIVETRRADMKGHDNLPTYATAYREASTKKALLWDLNPGPSNPKSAMLTLTPLRLKF